MILSPEFLLTALIVVASPGTGVLFTIAAGLTRGRRASLVAALGCTLGILPHMAAALLGLAALLQTSPLAFMILKYLGVAYLLYMAWATLTQRGTLTLPESGDGAPPASSWDVIATAVLVNVLNPKLSIFFLAFLPQFLSPTDPAPLPTMLTLSGVFMALTLAVFCLYGLGAAWVRHHIITRPVVLTWLRRTFATAFAGLGVKLGLAEG